MLNNLQPLFNRCRRWKNDFSKSARTSDQYGVRDRNELSRIWRDRLMMSGLNRLDRQLSVLLSRNVFVRCTVEHKSKPYKSHGRSVMRFVFLQLQPLRYVLPSGALISIFRIVVGRFHGDLWTVPLSTVIRAVRRNRFKLFWLEKSVNIWTMSAPPTNVDLSMNNSNFGTAGTVFVKLTEWHVLMRRRWPSTFGLFRRQALCDVFLQDDRS